MSNTVNELFEKIINEESQIIHKFAQELAQGLSFLHNDINIGSGDFYKEQAVIVANFNKLSNSDQATTILRPQKEKSGQNGENLCEQNIVFNAMKKEEKTSKRKLRLIWGKNTNIVETDIVTKELHCITDGDVYNDIQFSVLKLAIKGSNKTNSRNVTDFTEVTKFISVHQNISSKDTIDHIFNSQQIQAYAVGIDFQQDCLIPCIIFWVAEHLNGTVMEQLSALFQNEFEIIDEVVKPMETDVNAQHSYAKGIVITSTASAVNKNNHTIFQNFSITTRIWAKVTPDCKMGTMLSNHWKELHELGSAYFLDSVKVRVSLIPHENVSGTSCMIVPNVAFTQPQTIHETNSGVEGQVSGVLRTIPTIGIQRLLRKERHWYKIKYSRVGDDLTVTLGGDNNLFPPTDLRGNFMENCGSLQKE
ncbi:1889_t:CDS:2 [Dentiscutata erythropus]|uniref:1889_t:CDS:1 n=1 Tax=Dentiscutata erythropus TaxID=1348616 RepID=A0A9N8ZGF5_9GLOM|nr:1889_t:CDS:2 [Dentiscutata erythropus]